MLIEKVDLSNPGNTPAVEVARVNGVALNLAGDDAATPEVLRQRACTELLRQAAQRAGLLAAADEAPLDGVISEAASQAIEDWLAQEISTPEPSDEACRRYYAAHPARFRSGERAKLRHILFAVTPGTDVVALRDRAEACLLDVRCHDGSAGDGFAKAARELSNCPSGEQGGELGWLAPADCAPEFAREVFGELREVGVLPRLVHSRYGFHIVEVLGRRQGRQLAYDQVREGVAAELAQRSRATALHQYIRLLAGQALVEGIDLEGATTPLVQ